MLDRLLYSLYLSLLPLGFTVLVNLLAVESIVAQTIDPSRIPDAELDAPVPVPPPQDIQPPLPTPTPRPELPSPLPPPEEFLQPPQTTPETPDPYEPIPGAIPNTIVVKKFVVEGATVFSPEELEAVTKPYTNRPLSFAELFQVRTAITQLYSDRGYVTSGAYIPLQAIKDGVVTVRVVEGELEDIEVTSTGGLAPEYVRSRLAIATQKPLDINRLQEALRLLQLDPLIANLSAELSAGPRAGLSLLEVEVNAADPFNTQLTLDNGRVPSVGSFRRILSLEHGNLLGFGDRFGFAYANTDGSDSFDFSYAMPLNARNGKLQLAYGTSASEVIESPFDELDINSESRYYELTLRQPVIQTSSRELVLGLTGSRQESENSILDLPYPLSPGADDEGRLRASAMRFFQEWTARGDREVFAARSQFNLGVDAFDATINDDAPDSQFFAWRFQGQWVRLLAPDTILLLRTDAQLANQALLSLEQFRLGGFDSVRGYRQDRLLGDNGIFASAEVRVPIVRIPEWEAVLQLTPFVDVGTVWNSDEDNGERPELDPNTLASLGLGLRWQLGNSLSARFDWGIPLVDVDSRERTWQEQGLYFSINYSPF